MHVFTLFIIYKQAQLNERYIKTRYGRQTHSIAGYCKPSKLSIKYIYLGLYLRLQPCYFLQQAEHFCNAIGVIQQTSYPSKFSNFDRTGSQTPVQNPPQEDYAQLFAQLIARCAKDIDTLIESLPNEDSSIELQNSSLKRLEIENQETAEQLEHVVQKGELLLEKIQTALEDIAQAQLDMQISLKPSLQ